MLNDYTIKFLKDRFTEEFAEIIVSQKNPNIKKKPRGVSYEPLETRLLIKFLCTKCTKYQ